MHGTAASLAFTVTDGTARRVVLMLTADSGDCFAVAARLPELLRFSAEGRAIGDMV